MIAARHVMSMEEAKRWVLSLDIPRPRIDEPVRERLVEELELLGMEQIRVTQITGHRVWMFSAMLGRCPHDFAPLLRLALRQIAVKMGFNPQMPEIGAMIYADGRVQAGLCLRECNPVPSAP